MKKFTTQTEYDKSGEKGLVFINISPKKVKMINDRMERVDQRITDNNRKATEKASKIILNR